MNDLLQLMHDTMGKTANIKGSVALLKKDGISQVDADKLLDIIADQAKKLDEVIDAYYKNNKKTTTGADPVKSYDLRLAKEGDFVCSEKTKSKFITKGKLYRLNVVITKRYDWYGEITDDKGHKKVISWTGYRLWSVTK